MRWLIISVLTLALVPSGLAAIRRRIAPQQSRGSRTRRFAPTFGKTSRIIYTLIALAWAAVAYANIAVMTFNVLPSGQGWYYVSRQLIESDVYDVGTDSLIQTTVGTGADSDARYDFASRINTDDEMTLAVTARVLVSQDDVDLVRSQSEKVRVKLASRLHDTYDAVVTSAVPAASNRLANPALSSLGGGPAAADPRDPEQPKTLENWFEFELELPKAMAYVLGEHVYVRFEHASEPLAERAYRSVRQLFMKRFTV